MREYRNYVLKELSKLDDLSRKQMELVEQIQRNVYHPSKDTKAFERVVRRLTAFTDSVTASPIYGSLLKNLVHVDFYLLKAELDRSAQENRRYEEIKQVYMQAGIQQNQILQERVAWIRGLFQSGKDAENCI